MRSLPDQVAGGDPVPWFSKSVFNPRSQVISAIARGAKRGFKCGTFSSTTGALAASCNLERVIFEAACDVAGLLGVGEDKVKE